MSLFNEEIETAISMYITHSHLNMLFKILDSGLTDAEDTQYLHDLLKQEIEQYLVTYGGEVTEYKQAEDFAQALAAAKTQVKSVQQ
jgi:hypothetical protein